MTEPSLPEPSHSTASPDAPTVPAVPSGRLVRSEELFSGQREVLIAHGQEVYRLRLTRSNKLILHK